jgi:hypothetical protein
MVVRVVARTTCLHPLPRFISSAEGSACVAFRATGFLVAVLFLPWTGASFSIAAFASFHFMQSR